MTELTQALTHVFKDDPDRLTHIYGVLETALLLAEHYGEDLEACKQAALLHDITKNQPLSWHLEALKTHQDDDIITTYSAPFYHGFTAAYIAFETYQIVDQDTLNAIRYHTVGRPHMSVREKIIFISDYIEPNRTHASAKEVYPIAFKDLDEAIYLALQRATDFHLSQGDDVPEVALKTLAYYKGVVHEKT